MKSSIALKHIRRSNDPVGDAITRIRNAHTRMFDSVIIPKSNQITCILDALIRSGYILHYENCGPNNKKDHLTNLKIARFTHVNVFLKYHNSLPAIQNMQRISSPGKRIYFSKKKIKQYAKAQGWGLTKTLILSTSKGIFTHQEVLKLKANMGGESLCFVW